MKDNTVEKSDFNLNKEYEMFDVIYSISKNVFENEIKAWIVVGHVLNSSSEKRCYETQLCSYPISVFVTSNVWISLEKLRQDFVSRNREEIVEEKKLLLSEFFNKQLKALK